MVHPQKDSKVKLSWFGSRQESAQGVEKGADPFGPFGALITESRILLVLKDSYSLRYIVLIL